MNSKRTFSLGLISIVTVIILSGFIFLTTAQQGATVTPGTPETWSGPVPGSTTAEGGNITEVNISGTSQTIHWQGFWGQVSGSIALKDASGNTMYNWSVTTMSGNVYASNESSITWSNLVAGDAADCDNIVGTGADSCSNTFNDGTKSFTVAGNTISNVPIVQTYNYTGSGTFDEGILEDSGGAGPWVYVATIYNDANTFKNGTADFQMIVPVNGTNTVTYYFWIELA
ncbi:MAG TPA: hypothetical protein ENF43_03750 [Thermoplasmatales archaeon]|nr:hypothetical protein [Thermoplasmatales archaeon]